MTKNWLSLRDAADFLGVHPSTVRKWSNEGKLPVHLTQGGHRRFLASEVALWQEAQKTADQTDAARLLKQVILSVRLIIRGHQLESQPWYARLDEETREFFRVSGRELAQMMVSYLTTEGEEASDHARGLGQTYASRCRKASLDALESLQAFLFFRASLQDAMIDAYLTARIASPEAWGELLHKYSRFTDQVLVAILESYHNHRLGD